MRKLMWFTIGLAIACAICASLWEIPGILWIAAGLALTAAGMGLAGRRLRWLKRCALLALGAAAGFGWYEAYSAFYLDAVTALDGQTVALTAQCTDFGYDTGYGTAVDTLVYLDGKPYRARLYFEGEPAFCPGDYIRGDFRLQRTTPGGGKEAVYHQSEGIFLLGYQESDAELAPAGETSWYLYPAVLRQRLISLLDQCFPEDTAGFARALLLGDRSGIDYETDTAFEVTGISHIIAVSGLHVSILFGFIYTLGFHKRIPTALLGIPALLLFAAVAGFSPSVTRACIMQILMILAMLWKREYDGPTELAFSTLSMLIINPLVISSVSFQMSVGCIAGIFRFRTQICNWMLEKLGKGAAKLKRRFAGSVSVTLSAVSITTPLVAYNFGVVSLVGVLTNLLTLWVVNLIFYGIMLVCALGILAPAAGTFAARAISWLIRYVLTVAKLLAKIPLSAVYTRSIYIVIWLVFAYVLLAVFLFSRKRRPGALLCCGVLGLCLALAASWIEPLTDGCRMTVLDVGQGQSIILHSEGKAYLVDCGGSCDEDAADLAAETLMSQGIFRLDGVIVTHYDRDHAGGMPYLLTRIPTDALFLPDTQDEDGVGAALEELTGGAVYVNEDLVLSYGGTELTIFGPVTTNSDNESSLAVLFQAENCDILITGDRSEFGERMLLRQNDIPKLEILVAGHHGAKSSTCTELLEATRPAIVAISVGENYYGHPSDELLERLEEYGCLVYRTDLNGNLIFRR